MRLHNCEFLNANDGRHWQPAIDMRKQFDTTFEVFIDDAARQPARIDFEQHEIRSTLKPALHDALDLMRVGTMNKTLELKSLGNVLARFPSRLRRIGRCDVINHERYACLPMP